MTTPSTVLITGGTSGIGFGLAELFHRSGSQVIITGRSDERLERAAQALPGVVAVRGNLSRAADREELADHITSRFPGLNILINNAGIQRRIEIALDDADWGDRQEEIDLLLSAPAHLTALLLPTLRAPQKNSQIVNVTSGGAFVPQPFAPMYSAAKAALHSYTMNLRYALADTAVRVTELIPPAVATGLGGPGRNHGADVDEFCAVAFEGIRAGCEEVGFGPTASDEFVSRLVDERARFEVGAERFTVARFSAE